MDFNQKLEETAKVFGDALHGDYRAQGIIKQVADALSVTAGSVIVVAGVGGGVGTTSLALHLCASLAKDAPTA